MFTEGSDPKLQQPLQSIFFFYKNLDVQRRIKPMRNSGEGGEASRANAETEQWDIKECEWNQYRSHEGNY